MEVILLMIVVTYDVSTETAAGRRRLRRVAKHCAKYGHRVQNSVFECWTDAATAERFKNELLGLIDPEMDSIRLYRLGNNYKCKIESYGVDRGYDPEGYLAF